MDEVKVVTDLDRLITEHTGFRWNGKVHVINPISTELFLKLTNEFDRIERLIKGGSNEPKLVLDAYAKLFSSVCDTISIHDVREMTYPQIGALFTLVVRCVTGRAQVEEQKKSPATTPTEASPTSP